MNIYIILSIIIIHWFADFVLQTHNQAINKSKDFKVLTEHVFVYSTVWFCVSVFYGVVLTYNTNWKLLLFAPITFIAHLITDYYTSKANKLLWDSGETHNFFVSIGFDQVLHYIQLFFTYQLLT